ncbi:cache domain-containing sensor histidine kinase [Cohnella cholangitidis]|uniref:HAMP domain-containing protein n=1 Tax=Cohnella cholangitidis TaxID=2598458 RepID=A0A7G5C338_9BACL|nr:sensor histidine kinase [Cohnella cholangitidis]QMV43622.1 HAMP domain-containing protein [Cohnella cholangitidis]
MTIRYSLFAKILVLILLLLVPVILLIGYSHQVSVKVIESELQHTNQRQLSFLLHQMDTSIKQLEQLAVILNRDPSVRDLPNLPYKDNLLDRVKTKAAVLEKLTLQSLSSNWSNEFVVYSPTAKQRIGIQSSIPYEESYFPDNLSSYWRIEAQASAAGKETRVFKRFIVDNLLPVADISKSKLILEVLFDADNIADLLSNYQEGGRGSPFLYHPNERPIYGKQPDSKATEGLIAWLDKQNLEQEAAFRIKLNGRGYQVYYSESKTMDWYLVDFLPVEDVVTPIYKSRNLFFIAIGVLLATSFAALALLYRNIQIPVRQLVRGFKEIRDGRFSARVPLGSSPEFVYMQRGFNEMAKEIQLLVESVYEEKIRSKDARLKQLQAQVNPHFLYNCLAYITSMNELENREAVASMAHNLGDYYRFTTRSDKEITTLREELSIVTNYLNIQHMRMPRLTFTIDIPDAMNNLVVPRLSLQPIIENAVVHGIELKPGEAMIRIMCCTEEERCSIIVDDNGIGLTEEQMLDMDKRVGSPSESELGYGLWNTCHRFQLMFGQSSEIRFEPSPLGGLRVQLLWNVEPFKREEGC